MLSKALQIASANAGGESLYVEDVFSTYLYTGNNTARTIPNGIDLAGEGGLVWIKRRSDSGGHALFDTARDASKKWLTTNNDSSEIINSNQLTSFNSNGFSLGNDDLFANVNRSPSTYASWTFRKAEKFFDVVTYTGNGVAGRQIAHNLGAEVGLLLIKCTSSGGTFWIAWHRSEPTKFGALNQTDAFSTSLNGYTTANIIGNNTTVTTPTSRHFTVGDSSVNNANAATYVAYLFAHNAGGFGDAGDENVISCGSYVGNGSSTLGPLVNLGYEPQWLMVKRASSGTGPWSIFDTMRGLTIDGEAFWLNANVSDSESASRRMNIDSSTGFHPYNAWADYNEAGVTYIYIAIRRPMKTPESGTEVFSATTATTNIQSGTQLPSAGFPVDLQIGDWRNGSYGAYATDRLRGGASSYTFSTGIENASFFAFDSMTNVRGTGSFETTSNPFVFWQFRRASGFFDVVCYTGTGVARTVAHNLTVVPELIIVKKRSTSTGDDNWMVYHTGLTQLTQNVLFLNDQSEQIDMFGGVWGAYNTAVSFTQSMFNLGNNANVNLSSSTYVAYLFATLAGVSKVGSYTGNGSSQTINCGFTGGARFFLVKASSTTGSWWTYDSARGIISGNDPALQLNSTAAEVTSADAVDPDSSGIIVNQEATCSINASGVTYIFLAIA